MRGGVGQTSCENNYYKNLDSIPGAYYDIIEKVVNVIYESYCSNPARCKLMHLVSIPRIDILRNFDHSLKNPKARGPGRLGGWQFPDGYLE